MKKTFLALAALMIAFQTMALACGIKSGAGHAEGETPVVDEA